MVTQPARLPMSAAHGASVKQSSPAAGGQGLTISCPDTLTTCCCRRCRTGEKYGVESSK